MAKKLRTKNHRVILNRSAAGDTWITGLLIIMGVLMILPFYLMIINSIKPLGETYIAPPKWYVMKPTLKAYIDLFTNINATWVPVSRYIFNSIFISVTATGGQIIVGSLAAFSLAKIRFPGSNFVNKLIIYSMMIGSSLTGLISFFVYALLGWFNTYWISIIPTWCGTLGLYLMRNFIDSSITDEMLEAARIDGATELTVYMKIIMPLIKPAWLTTLVQTFQGVWMGGVSGYVWSPELMGFNTFVGSVGSGAGSILMLAIPIIVFVVSQSQIIETMASSGMKD